MYENKEMLKGIRRGEILIERKKGQLRRLEEMAIHSPSMSDPNGGGRGTPVVMDRKAELVASAADMREEIEREIDALIDLKLKAMRMIDALENADEADVLYRRYFEFRKWGEIAADKGLSLDWIFRLHRRALKNLQNNVN